MQKKSTVSLGSQYPLESSPKVTTLEPPKVINSQEDVLESDVGNSGSLAGTYFY